MHISSYVSASGEAFRNCHRQRYFTSNWRGIGYSFQLAITAPLYSIIGYCIATAQSWLTNGRHRLWRWAIALFNLNTFEMLPSSYFGKTWNFLIHFCGVGDHTVSPRPHLSNCQCRTQPTRAAIAQNVLGCSGHNWPVYIKSKHFLVRMVLDVIADISRMSR